MLGRLGPPLKGHEDSPTRTRQTPSAQVVDDAVQSGCAERQDAAVREDDAIQPMTHERVYRAVQTLCAYAVRICKHRHIGVSTDPGTLLGCAAGLRCLCLSRRADAGGGRRSQQGQSRANLKSLLEKRIP